MKKYFLIVLMLAAFIGADAQVTAKMKTTLTGSLDSAICTNTGTASLVVRMQRTKAQSIQVNIVKTSGTLAGTMTLYGSNDGVNWVALTDATSAPTITTYTVTDGGTYGTPQTKVWHLGFHVYAYYQISWVGSGTMAGYFKSWMLGY